MLDWIPQTILFIFILGLIIFVHEFGHFIVAKRSGIKVEEFGFGFPPRIFGKKIGDTIYSLNLIPLGGFVSLYGETKEIKAPNSFSAKPLKTRFKVLVAGVLMNFILGIIVLTIGFSLGLPPILSLPQHYNLKVKESKIFVSKVIEGSPASIAGIKEGDVISKIDDKIFTKATDVKDYLEKKAGKEITVILEKEGKTIEKSIKLLSKEKEYFLGIEYGLIYLKTECPFWKAPFLAIIETFKICWFIILFLINILISLLRGISVSVDVAGPVGVFFLTGLALKTGFLSILKIIALLTINVGLINILPFPALDGGRVLFLIIEKIRGKKVAQTVENIIHNIGFFILLALLALITWWDIVRWR